MERGIVGRRQVLYIAVSVGRYRIDRKDTISIQSKAEGERGIMSQRARERERWKKRQILMFVRETEKAKTAIIGNTSRFKQTCKLIKKVIRLPQ